MGLTLEGTVFCLDPLDSRCWRHEWVILTCLICLFTYMSFIILRQLLYLCQYIFEYLNVFRSVEVTISLLSVLIYLLF